MSAVILEKKGRRKGHAMESQYWNDEVQQSAWLLDYDRRCMLDCAEMCIRDRISAERIRTELLKLLVSPHPEMLRICRETGMTAVFLPEFDQMAQTVQNNPHHCYDVAEHTKMCIRDRSNAMQNRPDENSKTILQVKL